MQIGPFIFEDKEYAVTTQEAGGTEDLSSDTEMVWFTPFPFIDRMWAPRADFRRAKMKLLVLEWEQLYLFEDELEAERKQIAGLALKTLPTQGIVLEEEKAGVYYYTWPVSEGKIRLRFFERQENASHFLTVLLEFHGNWKPKSQNGKRQPISWIWGASIMIIIIFTLILFFLLK